MASIFDELFPAAGHVAQKPSPEKDIFLAASRNDVNKVQRLLAEHPQADLAVLVNGFSPLHIAAKKGYLDIITMLIAHDLGLLGVRTTDGRSAAMIAAYEGQVDALKLLMNQELANDVDHAGNTILHYAAWGGSAACTSWLMAAGHGDPALKNSDGMLPLQFAAAGNYCEVIELLLAHSSCEAESSASGLNALHRAALHGSTAIVKVLVTSTTHPYDPLQRTGNGSIAMHYAAQHGHRDVVTALLTVLPADMLMSMVNAQNTFGLSPLHYACIGGYADIAAVLLTAGADAVARTSSGDDSLLLAAASGQHEICKLLVRQHGADPFSKDSQGKSAVDKAVEAGYKELANMLVMEACVDLKFQVSMLWGLSVLMI